MKADIGIESDPQRVRPENREVERLWADNSKAIWRRRRPEKRVAGTGGMVYKYGKFTAIQIRRL